MKHSEIATKIIDKMKQKLYLKSFQAKFLGENIFSRKRKIDFQKIVLFIMNKDMKTCDLKLDEFYQKHMDLTDEMPSKQAVSKARIKLGYEVFQHFFEMFLENNTFQKNWKSYQIYAINGSDLELPTPEGNLKILGNLSQKNKYNVQEERQRHFLTL